tara:strand:+ start:93 stop:317 length:225 start_codon:yes stop_codon:yes gene_type:complete
MKVSEKKFELELNKRENIISQLRKDRNNMILKYQRLNKDFISVFEDLEKLINLSQDNTTKTRFEEIKTKFKDYF